MGDRGNIVVDHGGGHAVWCYSKWGGGWVHGALQDALKDLLGDGPMHPADASWAPDYLTGLVAEHFRPSHVGLRPVNNDRAILVVRPRDRGTVELWDGSLFKLEEWRGATAPASWKLCATWTFEAYVALDLKGTEVDDLIPEEHRS